MTALNEKQRAYWNERFRQLWGLHGTGSATFGRQFNAWRYRVRRHVFRRAVRRLDLEFGAFAALDVGSGTGFYLREWRVLGAAQVCCLDISDWALDRLARECPSAEFIHADIGAVDLAISAGRFDAVTAIDVLTHVLDDGAYSRALANIHRALKPGGHLLYTDSFFHGPGKRHEDYWRGRTLAEATEAIEASGFEIVSRVPFSVLMSAPTDTRHRERNERLWEAVLRPFLGREWTGFLLGAVLYPAERALVRLLRESPAIELMCCRKRGHEAPTR
jgi:SAM-dependent methyltransferase